MNVVVNLIGGPVGREQYVIPVDSLADAPRCLRFPVMGLECALTTWLDKPQEPFLSKKATGDVAEYLRDGDTLNYCYVEPEPPEYYEVRLQVDDPTIVR